MIRQIDLKKSFNFSFRDYDGLVKEFKSFSIEPINKEASIVEIKLKGGNVEKLVDFLNTLTKEYLAKGPGKEKPRRNPDHRFYR